MKRKLFVNVNRLVILTTCFFGLASQPVSAQSDLVAAINGIRASLDAIVNTAATYIFQTPPNVGVELVTNNTLQNTAIQTVGTSVSGLNETDIKSGLTPQTANPNLNLTQLAGIQASDTILPFMGLGGLPIPFLSQSLQNTMQNNLIQGNANFNFQSLLSPLVYTSDTQNYAMNYIRFISGYAVPLSNVNLASYPESQLSTKQKLEIQSSPNYQAYQVARRQLVAQQSAALSNLYWIYSRRLPLPQVKAGDTGLGVANPSVAQIEHYNATWRTASPTWYGQMSTSSQTNVEREILFVLAEIQVQLQRLHQDNERIIALSAINQVGGLQTGKTTLALAEKQVLDDINAKIKGAAQSGTTTDSGTSTSTTKGQSAEQQSQSSALKQAQEAVKQEQQQQQQQQSNK